MASVTLWHNWQGLPLKQMISSSEPEVLSEQNESLPNMASFVTAAV
jgi:hypothetical protein